MNKETVRDGAMYVVMSVFSNPMRPVVDSCPVRHLRFYSRADALNRHQLSKAALDAVSRLLSKGEIMKSEVWSGLVRVIKANLSKRDARDVRRISSRLHVMPAEVEDKIS